ncbi:MAG: 4-carboxy-4-hydroxy-2-oxoadipate aldolase/oxaloacetate decarboxylase [Thermoplasmatales archaeon]
MNYSIFTKIQRSDKDKEYLEALQKFGVATVAEAQGKRGIMETHIRPIQTGVTIAGTAVTVECIRPDNLMIHAALEFCQDGDILVVKTPESVHNGYFGELMATSAFSRGVRGLIIEGGVRDTRELREMGFSVWCSYISVRGTTKENPGNVNKVVSVGGVLVYPGDFIVANDDGIVVVNRKDIEDVVSNSYLRIQKENVTRERLKRGELGVNIYNLKNVLKSMGVKYENENMEMV